eukprot:g5940.t1
MCLSLRGGAKTVPVVVSSGGISTVSSVAVTPSVPVTSGSIMPLPQLHAQNIPGLNNIGNVAGTGNFSEIPWHLYKGLDLYSMLAKYAGKEQAWNKIDPKKSKSSSATSKQDDDDRQAYLNAFAWAQSHPIHYGSAIAPDLAYPITSTKPIVVQAPVIVGNALGANASGLYGGAPGGTVIHVSNENAY